MSGNATERLLIAAKALLEARENQMVTRVEWQALQDAVAAFKPAADREPRVGYDNVEFWWSEEELRVVASVIGYDDDGLMILSNPNFDDVWHVAVEDAKLTDQSINSRRRIARRKSSVCRWKCRTWCRK